MMFHRATLTMMLCFLIPCFLIAAAAHALMHQWSPQQLGCRPGPDSYHVFRKQTSICYLCLFALIEAVVVKPQRGGVNFYNAQCTSYCTDALPRFRRLRVPLVHDILFHHPRLLQGCITLSSELPTVAARDFQRLAASQQTRCSLVRLGSEISQKAVASMPACGNAAMGR
jgi:hypothetical protein